MPPPIVNQTQLTLRASLYLAALAVALVALPAAAQDGNFNANDCMEVRCETNSVVNRCDNPVNYAYCKIKPGQRGCLYEFSRRIEPGQSGLSLCQSEHQYAFTACLAPHKPVSVSPTRRQCIPDPSDPAVKKIGEPCDSEWESNIPGLVCDGEWTYVIPPDESAASAAQTLTADEQEWKEQQEAEKAEAEKRAREKECSQILNSCETACNDICEDPATCAPGTDATDCGYEKDEAAALRAEHRRARQEERERQKQREEPEVAVADENACDFANDGSCDEPHLCKPGTDTDDCLAEEMGDTCHFANDGKCDEPEPCLRGTDTSDCTQIQGGQEGSGDPLAALRGAPSPTGTTTERLLRKCQAWTGQLQTSGIVVSKGDAEIYSDGGKCDDLCDATHLHHAAGLYDLTAMRWLIANGADVHAGEGCREAAPLYWMATNPPDDYPLDWEPQNRRAAIELLISSGADVNHRVDDGGTPVDWAISNGDDESRAILENLGGQCNKYC